MTIAATVAASTGSTNGGGTSPSAAARVKQNGSASGGSDQSRAAVKQQTRTVQRERERTEREQLVLWRQPLQTLKFCGCEVALLLNTYWQK